jgi:hypothetical protein
MAVEQHPVVATKPTDSVHEFPADTGQRESITRMISSAQRTASSIAHIVAGTRFPASYCDSFPGR